MAFYKKIIILITLLLSTTCSNNNTRENKEEILVRIGDRVITVPDFISRVELTPRPFYCRGTSERDKIIALNSLIAEKLLAIEAGTNGALFKNETFTAYIKGRREQLMRDVLYEIEAMQKVKLDSLDVSRGLEAIQMSYQVEFYTMPHNAAQKIQHFLTDYPDSAGKIFDEIRATEAPESRTVTYLDHDIEAIQEALFLKPIPAGQVIGPIKIDDERSLILKIKDYEYTPAISATQQAKNVLLVTEKLTYACAGQKWTDFVNKVMHGKKLVFEKTTFEALLKLFLSNQQDNNEKPDYRSSEKINDLLMTEPDRFEAIVNEPFFKINDDTWTVQDFRKLVMSHPMVFRETEIRTPREYVQAFRTAVIDVIQDHFVTREAYRRGIDRNPRIKRKTLIWQDSFVAKYHQEKYIESARSRPDFDVTKLQGNDNTLIDIYVDSLQQKYQRQVEVNMKEWNKIKLISTDFFGLAPKTPYPDLVPPFPANAIDDKYHFYPEK